MAKNQTSRFQKFFWSGIPLHAVNAPRNPLNVVGIASEMGKTRSWKNVIKRVVETKDELLIRIGTAPALCVKLISDYFPCPNVKQAVSCGITKIASLAEGFFTPAHCWQTITLTTSNALSRFNQAVSTLAGQFSNAIKARATRTTPTLGRLLLTISAKPLGNHFLSAGVIRSTSRRNAFRGGSITLITPSPLILKFFRRVGLAYNYLSHDVNLRYRFANWLGSFTVQSVCGPFSILTQQARVYGQLEVCHFVI